MKQVTVHSYSEFVNELSQSGIGPDQLVEYALFKARDGLYRPGLLISLGGPLFGPDAPEVSGEVTVIRGMFLQGSLVLYDYRVTAAAIRSQWVPFGRSNVGGEPLFSTVFRKSFESDPVGGLTAVQARDFLPEELRPKSMQTTKPTRKPRETHGMLAGDEVSRLKKAVLTLLTMMKDAEDCCEVWWLDETYKAGVRRLKKLGIDLSCDAGWKMDGKLLFKD